MSVLTTSETNTEQATSEALKDINAVRGKFYDILRAFFEENPSSPKLVAALMAEASGYALSTAPLDKRDAFTVYAHETLDRALAQQVKGG